MPDRQPTAAQVQQRNQRDTAQSQMNDDVNAGMAHAEQMRKQQMAGGGSSGFYKNASPRLLQILRDKGGYDPVHHFAGIESDRSVQQGATDLELGRFDEKRQKQRAKNGGYGKGPVSLED